MLLPFGLCPAACLGPTNEPAGENPKRSQHGCTHLTLMKTKNILLVLTATSALLGASTVQAATKTWIGTTTAWATAGNWSPSGAPATGDDVTIAAGASAQPTLPASVVTVNSLSIQNGMTLTDGGSGLTVTANATIDSGGTLNLSGEVLAVGGTLTVNGTLILTTGTHTLAAVSIGSGGSFSMTTGTLNVSGDWSNAGAFSITSGTINMSGATWTSSGAFTVGSSTVAFRGTTAQTINASGFYNLTINNGTGGSCALGGDITIANALARTAGSLSAGSYNITIAGSISGTGATFTPGTGTVVFNGTAAQTTTLPTYYDLEVNGSGSIVQPGNNITINGNLTVTSGTFSQTAAGRTIAKGGSGSIMVGASGKLLVFETGTTPYSTAFTGGWGAPTLQTGSTVEYQGGTTATSLELTAFHHLIINKASTTYSLSGNTTVAGALTITAGTLTTTASDYSLDVSGNASVAGTLTANGSAISVGGNLSLAGTLNANTSSISIGGGLSGAGTLNPNTGTVVFNGSGPQSIDASGMGSTFYNLTINKTGGSTATLAGGAIVVSGDLTITAGTLATANLGVTLNGNFVNNDTFTAGSSAITIGGTGTQSIAGFTTTGLLTMSKTGGTATFQGNVNGAMVAINGTGGTLNLGAGFTHTFTGSWTRTAGALDLGSSTVFVANVITGTGGTVNAGTSKVVFNGTAAQTTTLPTYHDLEVNGTGNTVQPQNNITVNGSLTVTSGTFDQTASGRTIGKGGSGTVTMGPSGKLILRQTGTTAYSSAFTGGWATPTLQAGSTVEYQGASATSLELTTFYNLILNGTGPLSLSGNTTLGGNLTITAGTLTTTANNFSLDVSGNVTVTGTLTPNGSTITVGGNMGGAGTMTASTSSTFIFNGTGDQTINTGSLANGFYNLTINKNSGVASLTDNLLTVGGVLTITKGEFKVGGYNITVTGTTSVSGTLTIDNASGTHTFNGNVVINSGGTWNNSANEAVSFGGNLQNDGTFTAGTGTQTFTGASKTFSGANEISMSVATLTGTRLNNGTLTVGSFASSTSTLTQGENSTLNYSGTAANFDASLVATASGNTVNYTGAAQTVKTATGGYYHLTLSGSGTKILAAALVVAGDLTISAGVTFDVTTSNYAVSVGGNWSNSGTVTQRSGTVTFNGSGAQLLAGATTFYNLTVNNSGAGLTLSADQTVNNALTLTAGKIATGANSMIIGSAGTVTRTSGWIFGNEQKAFSADTATFTFHIGDSADYEPVTVTNLNLTGSATLKASTTAGNHPQLGTAGINSSGDVAQYWTLQLVSGTVANYGGTFTYPSGESSGTSSAYLVKVWNGSAWSSATVNGTPASTTTSFSSQSGFGDFAIGNVGPVANADSYSRQKNLSLKMLKSDLLTNDTGTATIIFTGVNSPSAQGATITASGSYVFYTPANNNNDTFTYTITDGNGATANGTVTVNVSATPSYGVLEIQAVGGESVVLSFYGIPDYKYYIQRKCGSGGTFTDLAGPITTPADGLIQYTNTPPAECNPAFYRTRSEE
jgi:hypothetical protein